MSEPENQAGGCLPVLIVLAAELVLLAAFVRGLMWLVGNGVTNVFFHP